MGSPGIIHNRTPIAIQLSGHRCMDELTTERALICKLRGSLVCLACSFFTIDIGICTTRHCQTSDRLMQELNVVVLYIDFYTAER